MPSLSAPLLRGKAPDNRSLPFPGKRKSCDGNPAPQKRAVHVAPEIGGQNHQPAQIPHALKQVVRFHIGVAIAGVRDTYPFARQAVRFIEEENGLLTSDSIESPDQVLFCLADIF